MFLTTFGFLKNPNAITTCDRARTEKVNKSRIKPVNSSSTTELSMERKTESKAIIKPNKNIHLFAL